MEMDVAKGWCCYDLGILVKEQGKDIEVEQQQPARKKARVNNPLTSRTLQECKCGS
jgi:hypothetical protein